MNIESLPLLDIFIICTSYFLVFFVASWVFTKLFPVNNTDLNTYDESEYLKLLVETLIEVFGFCLLLNYLKPFVATFLSNEMHINDPNALTIGSVAVMFGAGPFKTDLGIKLKILQNYLETNF